MEAIADPSLVVLVGPSGSGKTTWAAEHFGADAIMSSDRLRAVVGAGEGDLTASDDAFEVLDRIVELRMGRRLLTVIDSTGLDEDRRSHWSALGRGAGLDVVAVPFRADLATCRSRNRDRNDPVPMRVVEAQHRRAREAFDRLADEGFRVVEPAPGVTSVAERVLRTAQPSRRVVPARSSGLDFGLLVSDPTAFGEVGSYGPGLIEVARAAEEAGFRDLWVMDHLQQIPFVGPSWGDVLESYTTLAYVAACTEHLRLGVLVTPVTLRNVVHLAKTVATLDVLSGGRVEVGLGAGSHEPEHVAAGLHFGEPAERVGLLEDTVDALRALWGPGTKPYEGPVHALPETTCYPRPVQDPPPITIGGQGDRLVRLAVRRAEGLNLRGPVEVIDERIGAVDEACRRADRARDDLTVSHLGTVLVGRDPAEVRTLVEAHRGRSSASTYANRVHAAPVDAHVGAFRGLAGLGVDHCIVSLPDLGPSAVERMGRVIAAVDGG